MPEREFDPLNKPRGIRPDADHYIVRVTNMPPTELECKCGIRMEGPDCLDRMATHVDEGNANAE